MDTASERLLLSVPEAAALAGLSKTVAYRMAAQERLPGLVKLPGFRLRVRRRVLEAWLAGIEAGGSAARDALGAPPRRPPPARPGDRWDAP